MILKILLLIGLTRLLAATEQPFLCSGVYTAIALGFSLFGQSINVLDLLIGGVIIFLLSSVYFWLLNRFAENLPLYFCVLVGGLVIGLV